MASFNKVILLGNLTRDPEVRYTPKGTAVTDLGLAVNRTYTADCVEGRLQLDSWDDKQYGQKRTKLKVIGENMQMLGAPRGGGGGGGGDEESSGGSRSSKPAPPPKAAPSAPDDDEIPF